MIDRPTPRGRLAGSAAALLMLCAAAAAFAQFNESASTPSDPPPLPFGTPAPAFTAAALPGRGAPATISVAALRGHVAVIDFWATWCGPCKQAMPALDKLARDEAARGVRVIGVSLDDASTARLVGPTVRGLGVTYPIAADPRRDAAAGARYDADVLPSVYLLDRRGIVRWDRSGTYPGEDAELRRRIDLLLAAK